MKLRYTHTTVNAARVVSLWWKKLKPSIKAEYHKRAMEDKFRYYNEKAEYNRRVKEQEAQNKACKDEEFKVVQVVEYSTGTEKQSYSIEPGSKPEGSTAAQEPTEVYVPPYSYCSIAVLASQLDAASIDFLIRALK